MPPDRLSRRRAALALAAAGGWSVLPAPSSAAPASGPPDAADPVRRGRPMHFPRDHGAHLGSRIEWWYATGWLQPTGSAAPLGFQVTFFRNRTGLAETLPGRLAPRQLLFAHAALTEPAERRHRHADRIARWSGVDEPGLRTRAAVHDADIALGGWRFRREDEGAASRYTASIDGGDFALELSLRGTQPLLLQGDAGFSRKGPEEAQASHYVTEPQLAVQGRVRAGSRWHEGRGRAWIDHEWSDELLHPQAVGWDWVGLNLDDGRALTAFQLRRRDGTALWTGGSLRTPDGATRSFADGELRFMPGRRWRSPGSGADYPVHWTIESPSGRFEVRTLLDAQELDGRGSTGTVYWEGLSEVRDPDGRRIGLGYLEMTGYAGRLQL